MNLTRFLSFTRYTLLAVVVFTMAIISGCDSGDDGPSTFNGTTLEMIQDARFKQSATVGSDIALDSLVKYLTIYPELTTILSGTEHTLFAPSNDAFISLLATPGFPADIRQISPDLIKGVLSYHIVASKKLKKDLTTGIVLTSLFTDPLSPASAQTMEVNANGTLKTGSTDAEIEIKKADNLATNGVVHVVEKVMIPPSTGAVLTPILGTLAGTILLGKDFTLLARLIARADAGYTENPSTGALKISSHLARPVSTSPVFNGATFFATPNAVFEAAAGGAANANAFIDSFTTGSAGTARAVLLNHYVPAKYSVDAASGSTQFSNGATLTPLSGAGKTITVLTGQTISAQNPYGVVLSNTPATTASFRPIVKKDLLHNNGYVQVFGGILQ